MSLPKWAIPRRAFLRGLGATISLPMLEAMLPYQKAYGQVAGLPPRLIYLKFDLGVPWSYWRPSGSGANWQLPGALNVLGPHKNDLIMLRRVRNYYGDSHNEGPGDHARSFGTFLTCAHVRYGSGHAQPDIGLPQDNKARFNFNGERTVAGFAKYQADNFPLKITGSADQLAANLPWNKYPIKSIHAREGAFWDDDHHSEVNRNLSWYGYNQPATRYANLESLFDLIYGKKPAENINEQLVRGQIDRSILDTVGPTVQRLSRLIGVADQQRIEKYLDETRDLERSIAAQAEQVTPDRTCSINLNDRVSNNSKRWDERIRLSMKLFVKAFECDLSRVVAHGWSYGNFDFLRDAQGRAIIGDPHNDYSHHGNDPVKLDGYRRFTQYWAEMFAEFLQDLKNTPDGTDGSVFDNSMILFGSGFEDGHSHQSYYGNCELPIVLAGGASGRWQKGRLIDTGREIRLADVHLNMLKIMGYSGSYFGDSLGEDLKL